MTIIFKHISEYDLLHGLGYFIANIHDDQITASSFMANRPPWEGRLNNPYSSWIPSNTTTDSEHWIQIDFLHSVSIIGILIQGGGNIYYQDESKPYVTSFQIAFGNNETSLELINENGTTKVCKGKLEQYVNASFSSSFSSSSSYLFLSSFFLLVFRLFLVIVISYFLFCIKWY